jgi:hypothetical protein
MGMLVTLILKIVVKIAAGIMLGLFAWASLTAEVLNAPIDKTTEEFSREMVKDGRNFVVLRPEANSEIAKRGVRISGLTWLFISLGLIFWASIDFRKLHSLRR